MSQVAPLVVSLLHTNLYYGIYSNDHYHHYLLPRTPYSPIVHRMQCSALNNTNTIETSLPILTSLAEK